MSASRRSGATASSPGSTTIFLGDLPGRVGSLDKDTTWIVVCRSGMRAAIGGSILANAGIRSEVVGAGGVPNWLAQHPADLQSQGVGAGVTR